jgi:hypothetical protein
MMRASRSVRVNRRNVFGHVSASYSCWPCPVETTSVSLSVTKLGHLIDGASAALL